MTTLSFPPRYRLGAMPLLKAKVVNGAYRRPHVCRGGISQTEYFAVTMEETSKTFPERLSGKNGRMS